MLGKHFSRGRGFTMCKAFVLMGFIALAQIIGPAAIATDTHVSDLRKTFSNSIFEGEKGFILVRAEFYDDGHVIMNSPLGEFHGNWREFSGEICLDFETGPHSGMECSEIMQLAQGYFETDQGVVLRRIASVRRF